MLIMLLILIVSFPTISAAALFFLGALNINSRSVEMLLSGNFSNDRAREILWSMSREMIEEKRIFGFGFYGDRYVIGQRFAYGYPHNIYFEFVIQFGVLIGSILLGIIIFHILRMFIKCRDYHWSFLLVLLFSGCTKLLVSDSFWYSIPFWGLLGVLCTWNGGNTNKLLPKYIYRR